jgi:hypothetical protein
MVVADVIFNPPETWLLRTAADRGCRTIDGLGMLVNQAASDSCSRLCAAVSRRNIHKGFNLSGDDARVL